MIKLIFGIEKLDGDAFLRCFKREGATRSLGFAAAPPSPIVSAGSVSIALSCTLSNQFRGDDNAI